MGRLSSVSFHLFSISNSDPRPETTTIHHSVATRSSPHVQNGEQPPIVRPLPQYNRPPPLHHHRTSIQLQSPTSSSTSKTKYPGLGGNITSTPLPSTLNYIKERDSNLEEKAHKYLIELGVRVRAKSMSDRITDLPDWVAYHILSFLAVTDLTRFGCVSKRCRQLYLSTPSLNFDGFPDAHIVSCEKRLELLSSLDRFLLMYRGVNNIQRFRIYWDDLLLNASSSFRQDAVFRMMTWIHNAVSCNVEVLEIFVHIIIDPPRTLLPSSVFLCRSLRSLSISMCYNILKSPSLTSSSNLECLTLSSVTIEDEEIFKWISCSCKCIKELHLENVSGSSVTIESSSLRLFSFLNPNHSSRYCNLSISGEKLEEILIDWGFDSTCSKLLNIHAPNLKYLKWLGNLLFHQNFGKLMCLKKAELFLKPKADDYSLSSEVLCIINSAEALILSKEITMALLKGGFIPGLLENVSHLSINIGSWLDIILPQMVSIFGRMNNLSSLNIMSDILFLHPITDCCGFNMGYWRLQNFPFIHQLKEVTIELSNGSNGVQFAKYILEHAGNLKEMKIVYSLEQSKAIAKLKKSKRASKIATVVFEEDKFRMSIRRSFHL
ncbi:hypothetical protein ACFX2J_013779 [Malus domestica]